MPATLQRIKTALNHRIRPFDFVVVVIVVGLTGLGFIYIAVVVEESRFPVEMLWARIALGSTRDAVIELLGEPERSYKADAAPRNYYMDGYGKRERSISHEVLIYRDSDMILYVWIDNQGRVEDKFSAGS